MATKIKLRNRILSLLLTAALAIGMVPLTSITAFAAKTAPTGVWTDYASSSFSEGYGTPEQPYKIATAADLARVAAVVNSGASTGSLNGKHFVFTADIDLSAHRWEPICCSNAGSGRSFTGAYFDGNGKKITGLYVDESNNENNYAGLFGRLMIASIKDLTIENAYVKAYGNDSNAGILAGSSTVEYGSAQPQIENCHVSGTVEGTCYVGGMIGSASYTTIKNSTTNCTITGGWYVGGFFGFTFICDIKKCVSKSTISAWDWNTGGFVGYNMSSNFTDCAAQGTLDNTLDYDPVFSKAGGFVGTNGVLTDTEAGTTTDAVITNCHTTVKVTVANSGSNPGGFIGYAGPGGINAIDYSKTVNCSFSRDNYDNPTVIGNVDGNNGGNNDISALPENDVADSICRYCYGNTDHKYSNGKTCLDCGYKFALWTDEGNYDISWYTGHENDNNYNLEDAADLAGLAVLVNGLNGHAAVKFQMKNIPIGKTITINNDIDLDGKMWTPIGTSENPFLATFSGNDKTIKNMTVGSDVSYVGLFGKVGANAAIRDLKVTNSSVETVGNINHVGGIVGYMTSGTLLNCSYSGSIAATGSFVGGIIGTPYNTTVSGCVNYATVTAEGDNGNTIGGIAGDSMGYISNCANFGKITAHRDAGGIAGKVSYGSVENCYNAGKITASTADFGSIASYILSPTTYGTSLENCYYLKGTADCGLYSAVDLLKEEVFEKEEASFKSGEVAYLLNGKNVGTNFYQNLDNNKTVDDYPLPDSTHGKVYSYTVYTQCDKGDATPVVKYSNTSTQDIVPSHIYQYSASDNVITETCKNCESHTETATIVISSESDYMYSGDAHTPATVNYSDGWQGGTLTVNYENNINAGTNTATACIKIENKEATVTFSIKKSTNEWVTEPTISGWTFGETAATPSYKAKFGTVEVKYSGAANDGTTYNSDDAPTEAGSYKAIFTVDGTNNYTGLEENVDFTINKADKTSPTGISSEAETIDGKADGKIIGITDAMEYRKDGDTNYTAVTGTVISNLEDGTYYVRYKADANHNASADTQVTVDKGRKLAVNIPETQVGYTVSANKGELVWNDGIELTFQLADGYSKLDDFVVKLNGNPISFDENGKYTENSIQSDITISVTGVADITAPTAEITLGTNKWNKFWNNVTFGLFFKDTQNVTVTAADNGSGVDKIYYYLSATAFDRNQVNAISDDDWNEYTEEFGINPNNQYIIYVKAIDKSGNEVYISSEKGIVVDNIAPVISGIENGKTYCEAQTVTVSDKYKVTVTVNGTPIALDDMGQFTLSCAKGTQTVIATDKAGNASAEMIVTVNDGHEGGTATCTEKAVCKHCGTQYGETDGNNHDLENINGNAATVIAIGNKEYWHCKDCDKYFSDKDGKTEIDIKDTVIAKLAPEIVDGKGQSLTVGEIRELTFRSNAAYSDFVRVEVDGKTVDEKDYTVKEGSTIVTLNSDYVATLSSGEHILGIVSQSGTATTSFTVNAKVASTDTSPATMDNSHIILWCALFFVSGGLLVSVGIYDRKKKFSLR